MVVCCFSACFSVVSDMLAVTAEMTRVWRAIGRVARCGAESMMRGVIVSYTSNVEESSAEMTLLMCTASCSVVVKVLAL